MDVADMREATAYAWFPKSRWPDTDGKQTCPDCGNLRCYECGPRNHAAMAFLHAIDDPPFRVCVRLGVRRRRAFGTLDGPSTASGGGKGR